MIDTLGTDNGRSLDVDINHKSAGLICRASAGDDEVEGDHELGTIRLPNGIKTSADVQGDSLNDDYTPMEFVVHIWRVFSL